MKCTCCIDDGHIHVNLLVQTDTESVIGNIAGYFHKPIATFHKVCEKRVGCELNDIKTFVYDDDVPERITSTQSTCSIHVYKPLQSTCLYISMKS